MQLRKGNMWDTPADVYVVTGNATIKANGAVVMGRGAALECKIRFPKCDLYFGAAIQSDISYLRGMHYRLVTTTAFPPAVLGLLQVKRHFKDMADLDLIANSSESLRQYALTIWKDNTISMNFPGIGWGHRGRDEVMPIITRLPDNVTIWEYDLIRYPRYSAYPSDKVSVMITQCDIR